MHKGKRFTLISAALVAVLALATVGVAFAAPVASTAATSGVGARLGAIVNQAGGTIADIVAKLTGTTVTEVRDQREAGKTFTEIAAAKGVAADTLQADVLAARAASVAAAVKAGTITQAQADRMLANQKTRIATKLTSQAPAGCDGTGSGSGAGCGMGAGGGRGQGQGRGAGCGAGGCSVTPAQ
jgi:hypothetical protein